MSWDVSIIKFTKDYKSIDEIPDNEEPLILGNRALVHKAVLEFFPETDWSDPSWGLFDSNFGSIEFNIGNEELTSSIMLHVRASKAVISPIIMMCEKNSWSALDCSYGDILQHSNKLDSGLEAWRAYLDKIVDGKTA